VFYVASVFISSHGKREQAEAEVVPVGIAAWVVAVGGQARVGIAACVAAAAGGHT
jgi:hypothetical protein